jgi:uncharacterized protein
MQMHLKPFSVLALFSLLLLLSACDHGVDNSTGKSASEVSSTAPAQSTPVVGKGFDDSGRKDPVGAKPFNWDNLIPAKWLPDPVLVKKYNNGEIDDNDPRIIAMRIKMDEFYKREPLNKMLDGKQIKLPGFVVPLEGDGKKVSEFILVPYQGACIHVPPPPRNQTVYVRVKNGTATVRHLFDVVLVTGTMKVETVKSDIAEAGYTLYADKVEPYKQ